MNRRAGRLEWFIFVCVANMAGTRLLGFVDGALLAGGQSLGNAPLRIVIELALIHAAIIAVVLWVQFSLSVRRAHDRDGSLMAFWVYAAAVVAFEAGGFAFAVSTAAPSFDPVWARALLLAAAAWAFIEFGLRPGDSRPNRWGAPPKPLFDIGKRDANIYRPPRP